MFSPWPYPVFDHHTNADQDEDVVEQQPGDHPKRTDGGHNVTDFSDKPEAQSDDGQATGMALAVALECLGHPAKGQAQ
jgi:hypothetical protein